MAGTLRAEATLALANLIYIVLLGWAAWCSADQVPRRGAAAAHAAAHRRAGHRAAGRTRARRRGAVRDLIVLAVWQL